MVISVQAELTEDSNVTPTNTLMPSFAENQAGSDNASIYLPAVTGGAQPTKTPESHPSSDREFFISPSGDDGNSGASPDQAWATVEHAWKVLKTGDMITMLDGVYTNTTIRPTNTGKPDNPISLRAQNDGKTIIDGEFVRQIRSVGLDPVFSQLVLRNMLPKDFGRLLGHTSPRIG